MDGSATFTDNSSIFAGVNGGSAVFYGGDSSTTDQNNAKFRLNSGGSATFQGKMSITAGNLGTENAIEFYREGNPAANAFITTGGAATFAGNVQSGGNPLIGGNQGAMLGAEGYVNATREDGNEPVWSSYTKGSSSSTCQILAKGDATFTGAVTAASFVGDGSSLTGVSGTPGAQGPQGPQGDTGAQGPQGSPGSNGSPGGTGGPGPQGSSGGTGPTGPAGPTQFVSGDGGQFIGMNRDLSTTMLMSNSSNTAYMYGIFDTATGSTMASASSKRMYKRTTFLVSSSFTAVSDNAFVSSFISSTEPLVGRFLVENCEAEGQILGINTTVLGANYPELVIWDYKSTDMEFTAPTSSVPFDTLVPKSGVQKVPVGINVDAVIGLLLKSLHATNTKATKADVALQALKTGAAAAGDFAALKAAIATALTNI